MGGNESTVGVVRVSGRLFRKKEEVRDDVTKKSTLRKGKILTSGKAQQRNANLISKRGEGDARHKRSAFKHSRLGCRAGVR